MDDRIAALYRESPEDFVKARDALAKELRAAGDKDSAGAVKALRKPTVAAWALNEVATRDPDLVAELIDAGEALRAAQDDAMDGGGGDALREAMRRRRDATKKVGDAAAKVLDGSGRSGANQATALAATIDAVAIDAELAERVRTGTLSGDAPQAGDDPFGLAAPASGSAGKPKKAPSASDRAAAKARKALEDARAKAELTESARRDAAQAAEESERQVAEIRVELAAAEKAAKSAATVLDKAERAAADASAEVERLS